MLSSLLCLHVPLGVITEEGISQGPLALASYSFIECMIEVFKVMDDLPETLTALSGSGPEPSLEERVH